MLGRDEGGREPIADAPDLPTGLVAPKRSEGGGKPTPPAPGDENCCCHNQFGMDDRGKGRLNFQIKRMASIKTAKEIWIEQLDCELFRYCGPIFVAPALNSYPEQMIGSGTYALIDTGKRRLLVTCCHILDEYEKHHDANSGAILAISLGDGNSCVAFTNPKKHLVSIDRDLDLVVLEFEPEEIKVSHKKSWFEISDWPIPTIEKGDHIVTLGFPGAWRKTAGVKCVFGRVVIPFAVTDVSKYAIAAFSDEKNEQVLNDMKNSLGGISGSPAYRLNKNRELCLVGFAKLGVEKEDASNRKYQTSPNSTLPAVFFTHANFLRPDGSLTHASGDL